MPDWIECVGFAGTGLTLAAWGMKGPVALRVTGLASSVAFLGYGLLSDSLPVVVTEMLLMPLNAWRLHQHLREGRRDGGALEELAQADPDELQEMLAQLRRRRARALQSDTLAPRLVAE